MSVVALGISRDVLRRRVNTLTQLLYRHQSPFDCSLVLQTPKRITGNVEQSAQ
jgi:hypothetical protein